VRAYRRQESCDDSGNRTRQLFGGNGSSFRAALVRFAPAMPRTRTVFRVRESMSIASYHFALPLKS
jgi:hypothetical protein